LEGAHDGLLDRAGSKLGEPVYLNEIGRKWADVGCVKFR
jgi:hypothetical protein